MSAATVAAAAMQAAAVGAVPALVERQAQEAVTSIAAALQERLWHTGRQISVMACHHTAVLGHHA